MGLLSKLLGSDADRKELLDSIQNLADKGFEKAGEALSTVQKKAASALEQGNQPQYGQPNDAGVFGDAPDPVPQQSSYGYGECPWSEKCPSEPNQYNFPGPYTDYFNTLFHECYPQYMITAESIRNGRGTVYTFRQQDGREALVVELMSENSAVQTVRNRCHKEHIPYLRFYYDHYRWWNTRSYVIGRVSSALNLN